MLKLLYITAQHEGEHHSSISGIFGKHLRDFMPVRRVFVTSRMETTLCSGDDIFVSDKDKDRIFKEIEKHLDLSEIGLVIIRNYYRFLNQALRTREKYRLHYLIGFQQSYPFAFQKYYLSKKYDRSSLRKAIKYLDYKRKEYSNRKLLCRSDFFLPISEGLHKKFHSYYNKPAYSLGMGVDPDTIDMGLKAPSTKSHSFLYIGSANKIREFDTILNAFAGLDGNWSLHIYSGNHAFINVLINQTGLNDERIHVHKPVQREILFRKMQEFDVGINLMPDNPVWQTASPTKLMEYYACGIPCIMTPITECRNLFEGTNAGWFCDFNTEDIRRTLKKILATPKAEMARMGAEGRKIILDKRNYRLISKGLYEFLQDLLRMHDIEEI